MKTYLETNDSDTQVRSLLANMYLENEPEKAIPLYEKMLKDKPKDVVFLNNLAWLNLESNNLDKALHYSSMALELAPDHPNVIDTRGMALLKSGRKVDAWKAVLKAYTLTKGKDEKIALNYAEILILNKQLEEAKKVLVMITSSNLDLQARKDSLLSQIK